MRIILTILLLLSAAASCRDRETNLKDVSGLINQGNEIEWTDIRYMYFIPGDDSMAAPIRFGDLDLQDNVLFFFSPTGSISLMPQKGDIPDTLAAHSNNNYPLEEIFEEVPVITRFTMCFVQPEIPSPDTLRMNNESHTVIPTEIMEFKNYHQPVRPRCLNGWVVSGARVDSRTCPGKDTLNNARFQLFGKDRMAVVGKPGLRFRTSSVRSTEPCR